MKIICVSGGSYKSFYLNYCIKIKRCDLLVFNFGIIYDYVVKDELLSNGIVTKELMQLSRLLNAIVVAGVNVIGDKIIKSIIVCDKDKIHLVPANQGAKLYINNKILVVGDAEMKAKANIKVVLSDKKIYPILEHCSAKNSYIFCDNLGVNFVKNKKVTRNFNKYTKIILN